MLNEALGVLVENQTIKQNQPAASGKSSGVKEPVGTDHQEVEWQFEGADLERVESWLTERSEDPSITIDPGSKKKLVDTYYDTDDWRLYRAGYALRVRRSGNKTEATMNSLTVAGSKAMGDVYRRREISEPLEDGEVETLLEARGPVGEHLFTLLGARSLRTLFEIHASRQTFDLLLDVVTSGTDDSDENRSDVNGSSGEIVQDASGDIRRAGSGSASRVGEVALDRSEVPLGTDEAASLTRVEVEIDASSAADATEAPDLQSFVEQMKETLDLEPTRVSKYEAGLFASGLTPVGAGSLGPTTIDDRLSVSEVAFRVLRRQFAAMRAHEAGTRLGEDPEELHDMRVPTRRMRAAIKLFENALPVRARWFCEELKWVADVLGEVRDLDVQIEQLKGLIEQQAEEEGREALSEVVDAIEERRNAARECLLEALDSEGYERFESSFAEMLRPGPAGETASEELLGAPPAADEPILAAAPGLLSRPYRKWRKAAGRIDGNSRPEEYHDLRKKGKRMRYALEFVTEVYGEKETSKLVKTLKTLQDNLGTHQDLIMAADLLEQLATGDRKLPPQTVFVMGGLAERHRREAADLRTTLPTSKAYRTLHEGKKWKDFEKVMKKRRPEAKAQSGKEK